MKRKQRIFNDYKDLGFSDKVSNQAGRAINKDGSFNIQKRGLRFLDHYSFFHALITIRWWKFHAIVVLTYIILNLVFASLYMLAGYHNLSGIAGDSFWEQFLESFFFSTQTFTTVGYGRINPVGFTGNVIAAVESLIGLMSFALATGILYGRFSRPVEKFIYSDNLLVAPYKDHTALMFRIANAKNNVLSNVDIEIMLSMTIKENETKLRKFYELTLERKRINFLTLSWTVVHPIDENSPLFGYENQDFMESDVELLILINGYDDTYGQNVHVRHSYTHYEFIWNARFTPMFKRSDDEQYTILELDKISNYERLR
jgi:inward rectifier potassium channel